VLAEGVDARVDVEEGGRGEGIPKDQSWLILVRKCVAGLLS
jgi:hypothetical protein